MKRIGLVLILIVALVGAPVVSHDSGACGSWARGGGEGWARAGCAHGEICGESDYLD